MVYECINDFCVEKYDENGFPTEKYITIKKGTKWELNNHTDLIGGENHLDKIDGTEWIEISNDTLRYYFKESEV